MWRFVLALLTVVLISSILIGQLIDVYAEKPSHAATDPQQQLLLQQSQLIKSAIDSGMSAAQLKGWLANFSAQSAWRYELQALQDYPLPDSLMQEVNTQGVIVLESVQGLTASTRIDDATVLLITPQRTPAPSVSPWLLTGGFYLSILLLILLFITPFMLRLYRLRTAALAFANGDLSRRLKVGSGWYLKDIEQTFNHMAERLAQLMNDMRLLSGGLSHELRTPLARVRMGLDTLCDSDDEQQREKYAVRMNQNLDDMESLINALLCFSRLQHSLDAAAKTVVDVSAVLTQQLAKSHDQPCLVSNVQPGCTLLGSEQYFHLLISNLLSNALKHCHSTVLISLSQSDKHVVLKISDDGQGIGVADRNKIFQPFVRLAQQTPASQHGFGLGLALVERIALWLDAGITVEQCPQLGGACFKLTFHAN